MTYIGTATPRVDGRAKVTGAAKYAAEFTAPGLAHGSVIGATIARGRVVSIDTRQALSIAGVIDVLTHEHRPPLASEDNAWKDEVAPEQGSPFRPLYDDRVRFSGQPIALVVAEDSEIARFAASLVRVTYQAEPYVTDLHDATGAAFALPTGDDPFGPQKPRGNAETAFGNAAVRHRADYVTPIEHHNPMELYGSTVMYADDGSLTVYDKTQGVQNVQHYLCSALQLPSDRVRVLSPYTGGAFGSGLRPQYHVVLAAMAALALKRSVRVILTRQQMYSLGYRPAMVQNIALGANTDGTLDTVMHEALTVTSQYEDFTRQETAWSGLLYRSPHAKYTHKLIRLDLATPCDMRAPSAATALYALECAMDELAVALKLDPLELRLRCYSDRDQHGDRPYSSKALRECYQRGAAAFGWDKRQAEPRTQRAGTELVGWGMATGVWEAMQMPIAVRIALMENGHAEVSCATSDIGTGTYTIMAQVAADALGLPLDAITVRLGDSTLPQSPVEGGSWTAASVAHGIVTTADAVREELLRLAKQMPSSPLANAAPEEVALREGRLVSKRDATRAVPIADAMRHGGVHRVEQEKLTKFDDDNRLAHNTHSAVFAEVKIDEEIGVIRVTRVVSAVAGGRIVNLMTARSQIIGGVVWGIGMALHEETQIDHRFGRIMNADYAEYHVPVHADVPDIEVIFVDEPDPTINPMGIKGLGEIGIVGVAAAIANAICHATGKRVRDLPITLDKLWR